MTVFSQISKKIGWKGEEKIPIMGVAEIWYSRIISQRDALAFESAFRIYRFAPSPTCKPEEHVMDVVVDCMHEGEKIFRNMEANET